MHRLVRAFGPPRAETATGAKGESEGIAHTRISTVPTTTSSRGFSQNVPIDGKTLMENLRGCCRRPVIIVSCISIRGSDWMLVDLVPYQSYN